MAVQHRLADKSQAVTYSFLTGGLRVQSRQVYPNGDGWVTETYTLVARTTDANIISAVNSIDELATNCEDWWDDEHLTSSIWLEENATSETAKRALIRSLELTPISEGRLTPQLGVTGAKYILTIIRSGIWEGVVTQGSALVPTACSGETVTNMPVIAGSVHARIDNIVCRGDSDNTGNITTIWGGIRPVAGGDSDFDPLLELELAILNTNTTIGSDSTQGHPVGGSNNIITYAMDTSDYKLCWLPMANAFPAKNYIHWSGDYKILLRCKLSAAQSCRLHIDVGYKNGTVFKPGDYRYISNTGYQFIDMGSVSIPPFPRDGEAISLDDFEFQLYGERLGTATTFSGDYILLIPSKHSFKITNASIDANGDAYAKGLQTEDGLNYCKNYSSTYSLINLGAQFSPVNFVYPVGGGKLVIAGQQAAVQDINDAFSLVYMNYWLRYRTHGE